MGYGCGLGGNNSPYGGYGGYGCRRGGNNFALIVVLFILLIIVGAALCK
ncbi:YjcZ family sporulation protein [Halobacillus sp. A1]|nr:YjcZ family sporulation protein [Halobacillus sp. A1]MCP3031931.1 YjcZ family sporulation protein [Halobacillus sp. A1]